MFCNQELNFYKGEYCIVILYYIINSKSYMINIFYSLFNYLFVIFFNELEINTNRVGPDYGVLDSFSYKEE